MLSKLLSLLWPIQWVMQRLGKKEPMMTRAQVDELLACIKPGDLLVSYESQRFTSMFIKGAYDHLGITEYDTVIEAVSPESRAVDLEQWLFNKDSVAVIRPLLPDAIRDTAGRYARENLCGIKYDYSFSLKDKRLYCSELGYTAYANVYPAFLLDEKHDNILPIAFYNRAVRNDQLTLVKEIRNH